MNLFLKAILVLLIPKASFTGHVITSVSTANDQHLMNAAAEIN